MTLEQTATPVAQPADDSQPSAYHRFRGWVHKQHASVRWAYKVLVAIAGITIIAVGVILIPLPGPGWLIVFFGLAVLGLEFPLFKRISTFIKDKALQVWHWFKKRVLKRS